eukprot:569033-Rhodomonas_salina.1
MQTHALPDVMLIHSHAPRKWIKDSPDVLLATRNCANASGGVRTHVHMSVNTYTICAYGGSTDIEQSHTAIHPDIKYKKPQSQYILYQKCGFLCSNSGWTWRNADISTGLPSLNGHLQSTKAVGGPSVCYLVSSHGILLRARDATYGTDIVYGAISLGARYAVSGTDVGVWQSARSGVGAA